MVTCGSQPVLLENWNEMEMINKIKLGEGSVENVVGIKLDERENPEKKKNKNPDIAHYNWPPGDTETRTRAHSNK